MENMDIRGTFAILFMSVLFICMGYLIKKFNLAEFVSGYSKKKHENHKELISKYLGGLLLYNGLFALGVFLFNLFFKVVSTSLLTYIVFGIMGISTVIVVVVVNIKIKNRDKE